jgi:hypothetical protein
MFLIFELVAIWDVPHCEPYVLEAVCVELTMECVPVQAKDFHTDLNMMIFTGSFMLEKEIAPLEITAST